MTVKQIQQLETVCFMFKYSKNLLPNSFAHFFSNNLVDPNNKIKTRSNSVYFPSFCRLTVTRQYLTVNTEDQFFGTKFLYKLKN